QRRARLRRSVTGREWITGRDAARAARWRACRSALVSGLSPRALRGMAHSEALRNGTRMDFGRDRARSGAMSEAPAFVAGLDDLAVGGSGDRGIGWSSRVKQRRFSVPSWADCRH